MADANTIGTVTEAQRQKRRKEIRERIFSARGRHLLAKWVSQWHFLQASAMALRLKSMKGLTRMNHECIDHLSVHS